MRRHRHASLYLTFYSSTWWVRRAREAQRAQEGGKERRGKDAKAERGATPSDEAVAMPETPGEDTKTHAAARKVNKGGGWWELECQGDATEDDRSILTALTAARRPSTAAGPTARDGRRPRRRPSRGENVLHVDSCCFSVLAPSPTPTSTSASLTPSGHLHCRNGPWTERRCCVFSDFSDKVEADLFVCLFKTGIELIQ